MLHVPPVFSLLLGIKHDTKSGAEEQDKTDR
jgi:hypothetical protein